MPIPRVPRHDMVFIDAGFSPPLRLRFLAMQIHEARARRAKTCAAIGATEFPDRCTLIREPCSSPPETMISMAVHYWARREAIISRAYRGGDAPASIVRTLRAACGERAHCEMPLLRAHMPRLQHRLRRPAELLRFAAANMARTTRDGVIAFHANLSPNISFSALIGKTLANRCWIMLMAHTARARLSPATSTVTAQTVRSHGDGEARTASPL